MRFIATVEVDVEFITPNVENYEEHLAATLHEAASICTTRSTQSVAVRSVKVARANSLD